MTQSITLTASMRSNLASLKGIQSQMDTTQTRLSTGKKVNSAIDNASSYYQSRDLNNRAADLDSLLDSMGQGIQTIEAANRGLESITTFVEQAKSVASSAYALDVTSSDYTTQLDNYQKQFNSIVKEIGNLAKDSSYQGVNLLTGGDLTVTFNESRDHTLVVDGKDVVADTKTKGFQEADWLSSTIVSNINTKKAALYATETISGADAAAKAADFAAKIADHDLYIKSTDSNTGLDVYTKATTYDAEATYYKDKTDATAEQKAAYETAVKGIAEAISSSLDGVAEATKYLRDYSSELGNNFAIIQTRQDFTEALIDVLETGSDNLVLADMNEESANYLALQTRQQLAINSLALASQSAQSVLKLF